MARKILLADDSVTAQNMGRKILSDAGYEVTAVNNGSAALKKIAEIRPDVVVLDVYMPGYSGLEVCQRLKESPETARTPVLLTVGKLEPFKPEEAQRVRAEAFIVKPFEASELLSALSKLEDKVVPRPEPSKPGRFARAIAAVEAFDRDRSEETDSNGWKKRINFPQPRPAVDEKPDNDPSLYNAVNRDPRTVIETPAGKSASHREEELPAQPAPETSVDVTALAPEGVPKDVTPEEVAAIAAAAAQIQAAEANIGSDTSSPAAQTTSSEMQSAVIAPQVSNGEPEVHEARVVEVQNQISTAEPVHSEEASSSHDEPVTMAAAPESLPPASSVGSRWTAVSVALEADEAARSLEDEMQKAYAALAAADAFGALAQAAPEVHGLPTENSHAHDTVEIPGPPMAEASIAPAEIDVHSAEVEKNISAASQPVAAPPSSATPAASTTDVDSVEQTTSPALVDSSHHESLTSSPDSVPTQRAVQAEPSEPPVSEGHFVSFMGTDTALAAETKAEPQPSSEDKDEPGFARAAVASSEGSSFTVSAPTQEKATNDDAVHPGTERNFDAETGSAAAAWASWRQIREAQQEPEAAGTAQPPQDDSTQTAETQPSRDSASRAVAAGAEQIAQESSTASSTETKDVASIVESVLADLRPRLVEEISRKMGKKK